MTKVIFQKRVAVIAAGGYAKRMFSLTPKSFMKIGEKSYLELLLEQIPHTCFDAILIYCNRFKYLKQIREFAEPYNNVSIIFDKGVNSTIEIVSHAYSIFCMSEFVFFYGHAPRHQSDIINLLHNNNECVVSVYHNSTKKNSIKAINGMYIEPPIKIDCSFIDISNHQTWKAFIDSLNNNYSVMNIDAPSEFNSLEEKDIYNKYIESWAYRRKSNLGSAFGGHDTNSDNNILQISRRCFR